LGVVSGLPLLGVVTLLTSEVDTKLQRKDLKWFLIGVGGLVGVFIVGAIALSLLAGWAG
jgi:hypothetical protein